MAKWDQFEWVCRLWDELADFDAAEMGAALVHLLKTLCAQISADNAFWIGGVRMMRGAAARRDLQHGWRARTVQYLHAPPGRIARSRRAMQERNMAPGMTTVALTARAGIFRVNRLHDGFINFAAFKRTAHYRLFYESLGISDRMWIVFPINQDTESYFAFDRHGSRETFSTADAQAAAFVLRGLKWFHRQLLLNHGVLILCKPLTPTEQLVVPLLLTDKSEKEIASALGKSFHTTHRQVVEIFRKFGVNGRAGLMSLWLGKSK